MTDRAGRWATRQVGEDGRTVAEVARELDCDWHTVNDSVLAYGEALLEADVDRIGQVTGLRTTCSDITEIADSGGRSKPSSH